MTTKDLRIIKTLQQIDRALLELLNELPFQKITVQLLCERALINRSTFYLHYTDIYNMLETIENELQEEILKIIQEHPVSPFNEDSFPFIEDIFLTLWENKDICSALLGPNGDMSFVSRIESIISEHSLKVLKATFPENMDSLKYSYSFCLTGCIGLIKTWLDSDTGESPQHMADLTFRLIMNALKDIYP